MLLLQKWRHMCIMLVVSGMFTDVANSHGISSDDPCIAEILSPSDPVDKDSANFASQLDYHFLPPFSLLPLSHKFIWYSRSISCCHFWKVVYSTHRFLVLPTSSCTSPFLFMVIAKLLVRYCILKYKKLVVNNVQLGFNWSVMLTDHVYLRSVILIKYMEKDRCLHVISTSALGTQSYILGLTI